MQCIAKALLTSPGSHGKSTVVLNITVLLFWFINYCNPVNTFFLNKGP
jgi:hypothetical protein